MPVRRPAVVALVAFALAVLAGALALTAPAPGQSAAPRPNLVFIEADDMETDDLKAMPTVRRLAAEGTSFANSFVGYSLCCPSRSTFLTGQYNHNNGVLSNSAPDGGYVALDHTNTLPVWLQAAGYHTTHVGKYLNGYGTQVARETVPPGYSDWQGLVDGSTYRMYDYTINDNGALRTYGTADADYQTDVLAERAVETIRTRAPSGDPFYLNFSPLAPHASGAVNGHDGEGPDPAPRHRGRFAGTPLDTDPSYNEADVSDKPQSVRRLPRITPQARAKIDLRNRRRLASLLAFDEAVARMVSALEESGELDRTLIVFTSDNGWQEGEHRVPEGKVRVYDPSIRVPLIVRGPGFAPGTTADAFAINSDLAPTLAEAAGATPRRELDGMSLREVAAGSERAAQRPLLNETGAPGRSNRDFHQAIRTRDHLYVEHANGERELYDLRRDPFELANAVGDPANAGVVSDLSARLGVLKTCAGEACRRPAPGPGGPPPVPTAPTPPGSSSPPVTPVERVVELVRRRIRLGRDRRIAVPLRCAAGTESGCAGTVRLYARVPSKQRRGRTVLLKMGARRFALEAGEYARVEVYVATALRRRLARERRLSVVATARFTTLSGAARTARGDYRLTARSRR